MRISIYLSKEELTLLESKRQEGETVGQAVKRLAFANNNPSSVKEHIACLYQATKWVVTKYREGKIQE